MEDNVIVLAMHGVPPRDFPREEVMELFSLDARLELMPGSPPPAMVARFEELDHKVRAWPRTAANDPFFIASQELAAELSRVTGHKVMLGFNEFCGPSLDDALEQAAQLAPRRISVITPMMTRGGAHSEHDIPAAIERARQRHPQIEFCYVWPLPVSVIARFLAERLAACG
jgi:sirohydrochlorin cobaltochelatase